MSKNLKYIIERMYRAEKNDNNLTFHDILRDMYIVRSLSIRDIADEMGISSGAVHNFIKEEGLQKNVKCRG